MKRTKTIILPISQALIYGNLHLGNKSINREQLIVSIPYGHKLDTELFARTRKPHLQKQRALLASHAYKAKLSCHISFEAEESSFFISDELDSYTNRNQQINDILNIGKICFLVAKASTPAHTSTTKGLNNALSLN